MAWERLALLPVKKVTVMGTIGNTQGVSKARKPVTKASSTKAQRSDPAPVAAVPG